MSQGTRDDLFFRPPSEANSFIIRVMRGCSHNKCTFCNMFKGIFFSVLPLDDIFAGIDRDVVDIGPEHIHLVTSVYLEGGDPIALPTEHLLSVMAYARKRFPALRRFACYATARAIIRKTREEMDDLAAAGLCRVHMGLESGSDTILAKTRKGCTSADIVNANMVLAHAGIENDVSIMLGIGGLSLSRAHALETAALLNAIRPACVRIRTFVPHTETPMGDDYLAGRFILLEPYAILHELRVLVENLHAPMHLLSEHWSNFILFAATMPEDQGALLALISDALQQPRSVFRQIGICGERA